VSRPKLSKELKRLELQGRVKLERRAVRVVDLTPRFEAPAGPATPHRCVRPAVAKPAMRG